MSSSQISISSSLLSSMVEKSAIKPDPLKQSKEQSSLSFQNTSLMFQDDSSSMMTHSLGVISQPSEIQERNKQWYELQLTPISDQEEEWINELMSCINEKQLNARCSNKWFCHEPISSFQQFKDSPNVANIRLNDSMLSSKHSQSSRLKIEYLKCQINYLVKESKSWFNDYFNQKKKVEKLQFEIDTLKKENTNLSLRIAHLTKQINQNQGENFGQKPLQLIHVQDQSPRAQIFEGDQEISFIEENVENYTVEESSIATYSGQTLLNINNSQVDGFANFSNEIVESKTQIPKMSVSQVKDDNTLITPHSQIVFKKTKNAQIYSISKTSPLSNPSNEKTR